MAGGNLATEDWKKIIAALTNIKKGLEKEEMGMKIRGGSKQGHRTRLARVAQAPGNGHGGSARANREDTLEACNSLKTSSLEKLVGGGSSRRHTTSERTVDTLPNEAYRSGIDGLSKEKE